MVNLAIFRGRREEFLLAELPGYQAAVIQGTKDEYLKNVLRRYFKRFPPTRPHTYEPTDAELENVDDSQPDEEPELPDPFAMGQEAYYKCMKEIDDRKKEIEVRTGQIMRWFAYRQSNKPNVLKSQKPIKASDLSDPMFILTCRLLGKSAQKPRQPIPYNLWFAANKTRLQSELAGLPKLANGRHNAGAEVKLKQSLFNKQPKKTQEFYNEQAKTIHEANMREWTLNLTRPASKDPEARQVCIENTPAFVQSIIDLIFEFTGMHCSFLMGGPEPAARQMNIIGVHSGYCKGPVKMNFAEAESKNFHERVITTFSDYLRKCFSTEDIRAAVLPVETTPVLSVADPKEVTYCSVTDGSHSTPKAKADNEGVKDSRASKESKDAEGAKGAKPSKGVEDSDARAKGAKEAKGSKGAKPSKVVEASEATSSKHAKATKGSNASKSAESSSAAKEPEGTKAPEGAVTLKAASTLDATLRSLTPFSELGNPFLSSSPPRSELPAATATPPSEDVSKRTSSSEEHRSPSFSAPSAISGHTSTPKVPSRSECPSPCLLAPSSPAGSLFSSPSSTNSPAPASATIVALRDTLGYGQSPSASMGRRTASSPSHPNAPSSPIANFTSPLDAPPSPIESATSWPVMQSSPGADSATPNVVDVSLVKTPLPNDQSNPPSSTQSTPTNVEPRTKSQPKPRPSESSAAAGASDPPATPTGSSDSLVRPSAAPSQGGGDSAIKIGPPRRSKRTISSVSRGDAAAATASISSDLTHIKSSSACGPEGFNEPRKRRKGSGRGAAENVGPEGVGGGSTGSGVSGKKRKGQDQATTSTSKRRKAMADIDQNVDTAAAPSSASSLTSILPADCNDWIKSTLRLVMAGTWGGRWEVLLKAWLEYEKSYDFNGSSHLRATSRPQEIGEWIQRARSSHFRPTIDLETYEDRFWKWWAALQPDWRKLDPSAPSRIVQGNWEALDKPGKNGLVSVIAALFFWGFRLGEQREVTSSWAHARDDVCWVLEQLCAHRAPR